MSTFASSREALISLALATLLTACQVLPQDAGQDRVSALEQELDRLEQLGLAGQVLILAGEDILLARALGQVRPDQAEPISMNSVMPLASVSKPFTASAMLALAADGHLALDDALGQHLEGLDEAWRAVPLRHLLTHTAGLPAEIFNPGYRGPPRFEPIDRDELLRRVNQFPPHHAPGQTFVYSNLGYNLVAAVIEAVSGQPVEHYLRERLLSPAGISDVGLMLPSWPAADLVMGRNDAETSGHHVLHAVRADGMGWHSRGSGDLLATPGAIAAWWQTLRDGSWLPPPWLQDFLTPQVDQPDGRRYGFGLEFRHGPHGAEIGHTGSDLDFTVDFTWYRDHDWMVYVAVADRRWRADHLSQSLAERLLSQRTRPRQGGRWRD